MKNQRIWERSKWGEYRSPWPKVDYAWVDGSVPKKGSRAAPRPRAKWYRLRGWESWTRGWTTLSRFPPHSRGSPSTPWTFLLLQDRKIHDLKRGSSSSLKLRLQLFLLDHWTQQRSLLYAPSFATLAPAFFPSSSEYRSFNSHTLKTSGFVVPVCLLLWIQKHWSNRWLRFVRLTHGFLSNSHCKFSWEISRTFRPRFDWRESSTCPWGKYSWQTVYIVKGRLFPFLRSKHWISVDQRKRQGSISSPPVLLFPAQTYRYFFKHVQVTSKSRKKKTLDRSHDEFQLASLLYRRNSTTIKSQQLFRTPQTTFITNFSKLSTP